MVSRLLVVQYQQVVQHVIGVSWYYLDAEGCSGIVVSDPNGGAIDFDYYEGSDDGGTDDGGTTGGGEVTDGCDCTMMV